MQRVPENLEANLYYLRARIYQLAAQPSAENAQMWQDIESRLAALEKATDGTADVKLLQFRLAMQQSNLTRAESLLTQLKNDGPSQQRIVLAEAELLAAQDKTDEAISKLKQTIKESPDAVEPVTYLAILFHRQGNREDCQAVLKDALARIEQPAAQRELGLLLAQIYIQWREQDKAHELLETLIEKLPNDIPLKRRLLTFEQVLKDRQKAQQVVNDIKALEGDDGWQWRYEQARVWFTGEDFKQRYPQITSLLQENLLSNADDQASRALLAAAYDRGGELQLAISTYREALSRSPSDLRIIIPAVATLYRAKENDQADEILNRASQKKLYHPELQALQFQSHLRRGELVSASDILEDLLKNDPNNRAVCLTLAGLKMQQNEFAEAEQLLDKLETQEPNSLAVVSAQVKLKIREGKSQEALRRCDEIINNLNNASAYIFRARAYTELGQADKAIEDLEHASSIEPNNVEVWTAKSDFYRSVGQPDRATDCLQEALSLAPDNVAAQKRAIPLFLASGNRDRILQGKTILDKALASNPEDIELRLLKARSVLAEGTAPAIENAERILEQITQQQPEISEAWVLLGEISLSQEQPAKALDAAMRGLFHRPNDKTLLLLKARAESARSPILAIPTLRALRELDPNDVDIMLRLANTYSAAGEPKKAVSLLEKHLTSCEDASERRRVNIALAVALHRSGNKTDAQKKFDSLFESAPDDPAPLLAQVQVLKEEELWSQLSQNVTQWYQNHPQDTDTLITIARDLAATENSQAKKVAEDLLRGVLEHSPNNLPAMSTLAILFQTTGRHAESAGLYQQILQFSPDNVIAMNNLAWILCEEQGKFQQALELVQRGLKIAPQYIDLIDTRGVVYYRLGELEKAIQDFTTCLDIYPNRAPPSVASRFHLARALAKNGQAAKAIEQLNQALDLQKQIEGLSTADLAEAHRLRVLLQEGS